MSSRDTQPDQGVRRDSGVHDRGRRLRPRGVRFADVNHDNFPRPHRGQPPVDDVTVNLGNGQGVFGAKIRSMIRFRKLRRSRRRLEHGREPGRRDRPHHTTRVTTIRGTGPAPSETWRRSRSGPLHPGSRSRFQRRRVSRPGVVTRDPTSPDLARQRHRRFTLQHHAQRGLAAGAVLPRRAISTGTPPRPRRLPAGSQHPEGLPGERDGRIQRPTTLSPGLAAVRRRRRSQRGRFVDLIVASR